VWAAGIVQLNLIKYLNLISFMRLSEASSSVCTTYCIQIFWSGQCTNVYHANDIDESEEVNMSKCG